MMTIILDSRALVHGVKIPLVDKDTTTPIINRVQRMIDEIYTGFSKPYHFFEVINESRKL